MMPIQQAINIKYAPTKISVGAEVFQDKLRHNLSFNVFQDNELKQRTIMIIEFKRLGVIRREEFEAASCKESEVTAYIKELRNQNKLTTIYHEHNAHCLTKQATAYARKWKCAYVAVCNYDDLVLLRFTKELDIARMTVVERKYIRKALLGFLIEACDDAGLT
jgi:hypothetical protein